MERRYWDDLAVDFEDQILNVYTNDKLGTIKSFVDEYIAQRSDVADFGCGIGWGVPLLAERARSVYAVDISTKLLQRARRRCRTFKNVYYIECDIEQASPPIPKVQGILGVNVLISPISSTRQMILRSMERTLMACGALILVVPSFESQLWVYNRLFERSRTRSTTDSTISRELKGIANGTVCVSGIDTKFFLRPELEYFLESNGFKVLRLSKLTYSWHEELIHVNSCKITRPWHWLVAASRINR